MFRHALAISVAALLLCACRSEKYDTPGCRYFVVHRDLPAAAQIGDSFLSQIADSLRCPDEDTLRLGVSVVFNILGEAPDTLEAKLRRILALSSRDDIPIYINIDGQNWTDHRPDLWNWWDPSADGYDPANRLNVEWCTWDPESAVKVCWRDWGRQLRVRPALNIFSPRVIEAHRKGFRLLLPVIREWYDALPADRKHLFIGLHIGWEAGFNYNAYHYRGGNDIFDAYPDDPSHDPAARTTTDPFSPDSNTEILGHAAAATLGIKNAGELTNGDFEEMIHRYLEMWCREAASFGFTPGQIYTHMGGNYHPFERHLRFWPAINDYSTPGWSLYSLDPHHAGSLDAEMETAGRRSWAATEWLWLADSPEQILRNIQTAYTFRDCRMVVYYNWRGLVDNPAAREAIRGLWEPNENSND